MNTRSASPLAIAAPVVTPRILRIQQVQDRTGLSRTTIWRLERRDLFPKHRRISTRAVGWLEAEVTRWIESRADITR